MDKHFIKAFFITALIVATTIACFYALNMYIYNEKQADVSGEQLPNGEVTKTGVVLSLDSEQVMADGPYLVTIQSDSDTSVIAVPSFGMNLCAAYAEIIAPADLNKGDVISVRGKINEQGHIVPCDSSKHFLKKQ